MSSLDRTTTMSVGPAEAYAYLADPRHLSEYVPTMEHVETVVMDEESLAEASAATGDEIGTGQFFADAATRRVEWAAPGAGFALSIVIGEGTSRTSQLTIRLETDDATDHDVLETMLEQTVGRLRRALSRR